MLKLSSQPRGALKVLVTFLLLLAPLTSGAGFDVELTINSVSGFNGVRVPPPSYLWQIREGNRVLGSGDWLSTKKAKDGLVYLESQLPVTVAIKTNQGFTDGFMLYRDMKRDFNQGADHCKKVKTTNVVSFSSATTCHFDHE